MRAGSLRHRIEILKRSKNEWDEPVYDQALGKISAAVKDESGGNTDTAGTRSKTKVITVKIRWNTAVNEQHAIRWYGVIYPVSHIERDPKKRFMVLTCEAER